MASEIKPTVKRRLILPATLCLLALFCALSVIAPHPKGFYPVIEVEMADPAAPAAFGFLFNSQPTLRDCEALTGKITQSVLGKCPQCRIRLAECSSTLDDVRQNQFTDAPLDTASGRISNGIVVFKASRQDAALAGCKAAEAMSRNTANPLTCYPAGSVRAFLPRHVALTPWHLALLLAALSTSWFVGWLIIKYEYLHSHLSHDHAESGPQKYHTTPTPRIGGLMLFAALAAAGSTLLVADGLAVEQGFGLLLLAGVPAFAGGLVEDLTKKVGVLERLLLTILSGAIASWLLGATLQHLGLGGAYTNLASAAPIVAVVFTALAVGGVSNSLNLIDGYNGLASGFAVIVLSAMGYVAYLVGDNLVLVLALALAGAILGFMTWNWPGGKIFLGDGGSYLVGFLLAEISVLLATRNPEVSPWFPLLLLIYPIFETLYSIYRRKILHSLSPGEPDNKHLHQLIHDHIIINRAFPTSCSNRLNGNNRVAPCIWAMTLATSVLACVFWQSTPVLSGIAAVFCVFYVVSYRLIISGRLPYAPPPTRSPS